MKISLRWRLTAWYSLILGVTLLALGASAYLSVSNDLRQNLEQSLLRVAGALDDIIRKKQIETMQPLKPAASRRKKRAKQESEHPRDSFAFFRTPPAHAPDTSRADTITTETPAQEEQDEVWSAVYEHILLNSKNFYIQIADPQGRVVWRSDNLQNDSLPLISRFSVPEDESGIARMSMGNTVRKRSSSTSSIILAWSR